MKFSEIPKTFYDGGYSVDTSLRDLLSTMDRYSKETLILKPDYHRGHVWQDYQRIAFMEYVFQGGRSESIRLNQVGKNSNHPGPITMVDGLQRLTSMLMFLGDKLPIFNTLCSEFEGKMGWEPIVNIRINSLPKREYVLLWYLELNSGGVPNTKMELANVQGLLEKERNEQAKTQTSD